MTFVEHRPAVFAIPAVLPALVVVGVVVMIAVRDRREQHSRAEGGEDAE